VASVAENPYNEFISDTTLSNDIVNGKPLVIHTANNYDTNPVVDLNGHDLNVSGVWVYNGTLKNGGAATTITTEIFDTSSSTATLDGTNIDVELIGSGDLKMKGGQILNDVSFNGATTIFQNTKLTGALSIADGATVTDGAGTFRINATNTGTPVHSLLGSWDFPIYLDGGAALCSVTVSEPMGGTVYFNETTVFAFGTDSIKFIPDGWCDLVLPGWNEAALNLYGAFYFNGDAIANMTVADDGRYALWNGSASLGIFDTDGYINATLNATSTLTFTINPCPRFVTTPDVLDYYGGRYYYNADTNEELNGIAQTYVLTCNFDSQFVIADSGEVQGDISDSLQHNYSLLVSDALGGYTYLNWTVDISLLQWNLHATITSEENGWLKVKYDFDFASNKSLLTNVAWNFGDGNGSKDMAPVHAYDRAGVYLVTLIMFDEFGRSGTTTVEITVGDPEADQGEAYLNYWLNERLAGAAAIVLISVLLAALYVYVAEKEWGGSYRLFPVAIILMGFIIALLVYGGN
jgi:hypothetical protein